MSHLKIRTAMNVHYIGVKDTTVQHIVSINSNYTSTVSFVL